MNIEPNENYQRMRQHSIQNDSVRAVYRNRLHPDDIVNIDEPPKPASVSLTPLLNNIAGPNLFPATLENQVKPSRSGQLEDILEKNAASDQHLKPIAVPDQKRGSAPEIRFKP